MWLVNLPVEDIQNTFFPLSTSLFSFFSTLSPFSCFLELIFRMISWPQNVLITESWSTLLQGCFFRPGNSVFVRWRVWVCVCLKVFVFREKGGKLGFLGWGHWVLRQGYLSLWWTSEGPGCPCAPDLLLRHSTTPTSHSVRQLNPGGGTSCVWKCFCAKET